MARNFYYGKHADIVAGSATFASMISTLLSMISTLLMKTLPPH